MTTLAKFLTTLTITLSVTSMANGATLQATDKSLSTNLCMKAAQGNRAVMHNAIKESGLSKSFVVYNIQCNNQNITEFVAQYGQQPEKINSLLNQGKQAGKVSISDIASL